MFLHLALADGKTFRGLQDKRIPTGFYVVHVITDFNDVHAQILTPAGEIVSDVEAEVERVPVDGPVVPELKTSGSRKGLCFTADVSGRINTSFGTVDLNFTITFCLG